MEEEKDLKNQGIKSKEHVSLGWRVAVVFMVLGVPAIVFGSMVLMSQIGADKEVKIKQIEVSGYRK